MIGTPIITIVDYGMGNLFSIKKIISRFNTKAILSSNPYEIKKADKIILPGVGHFGKAVENIRRSNMVDVISEAVLVNKKPILGICLGMQLFAKHSEEGNEKGFGWIDAEVVRFKINNKIKYKVPHIGWNNVISKKESILTKGLPISSEFYFVHSYHFHANNPADILFETEYESRFVSAVEKENIFGIQFHPEKSHLAGETLIKNFIEL